MQLLAWLVTHFVEHLKDMNYSSEHVLFHEDKVADSQHVVKLYRTPITNPHNCQSIQISNYHLGEHRLLELRT